MTLSSRSQPSSRRSSRRASSAVLSCLLASLVTVSTAHAQPTLEGCPILPANNIWNTPVDGLPVHPLSAQWVQTIGAQSPVHPDFGSGEYPPGSGSPIGIPFVVVPNQQPRVPISFLYDDESDPGPYPIPPSPPIEGGPNGDGDRHILVFQRGRCELFEVFDAQPQTNGSWFGGSGAVFDLESNALRPSGWTSADAAGLPIFPGLVRWEEVAGGEIEHALRFTAPQTRREFIWPARHFASSLTGAQYPPMGARFRLKSSFDISGYSPRVRVILRALKRYGMMLADNGSSWFLSGVPDDRWDNDELRDLRTLRGNDFEAVDTSSLMVNPNSGATTGGGGGTDPPPPPPPPPPATPFDCIEDEHTMCLNSGRFEVTVSWRDFAGHQGLGTSVDSRTDDSGLFWFFFASNWELLVKVIDGCGNNGHYWVFAAATTNVEYELRVRDSSTGLGVSYPNPLGRSSPAITDTTAFDHCP